MQPTTPPQGERQLPLMQAFILLSGSPDGSRKLRMSIFYSAPALNRGLKCCFLKLQSVSFFRLIVQEYFSGSADDNNSNSNNQLGPLNMSCRPITVTDQTDY